MPKPSRQQTVEEALREAMEKSAEMKRVLIIWDNDDTNTAGSMDSDLTIQGSLYLVKLFEHWLLGSALKG
jgi:hypothetical protein